MSNRNKNHTQQKQEQFTENCCYLGLKLLAEESQQMVDRANERDVGYYEFISEIV
jgi:hypothetical protein